jgi:hypothetical protein
VCVDLPGAPYGDDPGDDYDPYLDDPEEYEAAQRAAEEPPDWYLEQQAEEQHERHCAEVHGGAQCDCPPYVPPRCRRLLRLPRWSQGGWVSGTPRGCDTVPRRTPWAAVRAHRQMHEAPF